MLYKFTLHNVLIVGARQRNLLPTLIVTENAEQSRHLLQDWRCKPQPVSTRSTGGVANESFVYPATFWQGRWLFTLDPPVPIKIDAIQLAPCRDCLYLYSIDDFPLNGKVTTMRCPFCKVDNDRVIDTRPSEDGGVIRRRRECLQCNKRFTTHERLEEMPVRVIKKSGRREPFDRSKILGGVVRAVEKRSISTDAVEKLVDEIERQVMASDKEIASRSIGELVMMKLRAMDEVAYVRFASVYREYQAVDEFIKEIREITPAGRNSDINGK